MVTGSAAAVVTALAGCSRGGDGGDGVEPADSSTGATAAQALRLAVNEDGAGSEWQSVSATTPVTGSPSTRPSTGTSGSGSTSRGTGAPTRRSVPASSAVSTTTTSVHYRTRYGLHAAGGGHPAGRLSGGREPRGGRRLRGRTPGQRGPDGDGDGHHRVSVPGGARRRPHRRVGARATSARCRTADRIGVMASATTSVRAPPVGPGAQPERGRVRTRPRPGSLREAIRV